MKVVSDRGSGRARAHSPKVAARAKEQVAAQSRPLRRVPLGRASDTTTQQAERLWRGPKAVPAVTGHCAHIGKQLQSETTVRPVSRRNGWSDGWTGSKS